MGALYEPVMVAIVPFIRSLSNMDDSVAELNRWLVDQAIHVPDGWVEACVQWLVEEHGGLQACNQLTMSDWCQLIYEQWLHTDLHQLACAVLPESAEHTVTTSDYRSRTSSLAMKLEGELCLQVVGLFNVGDSYYGQLRHNEGNLSANIPPLDNLDADLGADPDLTQMTQAVSQYNTLGWNSQHNYGQHAANSSCKSYALFLTDGLTQIKAVEFGSLVRTGRFAGQRVLSVDELNRRLRPGVKVRLRGPLTLRNNVLLLPAGAIDTLGHPQLQVLGGEVDEVLNGQTGNLMYQLAVFLARKLNISLPEDGTLPVGFPRVTQLGGTATADPAHADTTTEREMTIHDDHPPVVPMVHLVASSSGGQAHEPWDNDDDALLTEAAQSFEQLMSSSSSQVSKGDFNQPETKPCSQLHSAVMDGSSAPNADDSWEQTDISLEVDPDVLASAFDELESANLVNKPSEFASPDRPNPAASPTPAAKQGTSTLKNSGTKSSLRQTVLNVTTEKPSLPAVSNTGITTTVLPTVVNASESDDLLPPAPKRKPWERKKPLPSVNQPTAGGPSTSATSQLTSVPQGDFSFRPFCYIEFFRRHHRGSSIQSKCLQPRQLLRLFRLPFYRFHVVFYG
ncbi:hypothetical protein CRM22_010077 [Opisthorchis felineus]|uniref:RecQ-mediated genome instability protein 1 n=1 Tax=Opisthorchis felineus TaxID=147828 RepID=A0A4S2L8H1_OPIFE|nr:hypothetical protein CRM22_010077 [Opisthorchis felineus]